MTVLSVIDRDGNEQTIEVPEEISLSLMEVLKASGYDIAATCGGIALCATCHVHVLEGADSLNAPTDAEMDMLDTLPDATPESRLACQVRVNKGLHGARIALHGQLAP